MQDFKNNIYNYKVTPPEGMWERIADKLDDEKVIKIHNYRKSKFVFYGATAAASVVIIFLGSLFFKKNEKPHPSANVPVKTSKLLAQKIKDSINLNQKILESIIHNPKEKKEIIAKNSSLNRVNKKYITVANPDGQPVKISPKVATLIISADNEFPPKPIWNKKIREWQKIMLSTTVLPTSANLIDVVQLASKNDNSIDKVD